MVFGAQRSPKSHQLFVPSRTRDLLGHPAYTGHVQYIQVPGPGLRDFKSPDLFYVSCKLLYNTVYVFVWGNDNVTRIKYITIFMYVYIYIQYSFIEDGDFEL